MQISLNGAQQQIPDDISMAALVERLGFTGKRIAVEVNEELVPRSTYSDYSIKPHDAVEIVHAIGGG
ncbi:Sulfur carrier protein ThiS [hydrothermal vent metagenome]|uniref:Sulfur carrier protein ThiS n=1 Tax=hydrothermal vent metagenome TaxID=652676 RepID=A0A3B1BM51_9ZZZZ